MPSQKLLWSLDPEREKMEHCYLSNSTHIAEIQCSRANSEAQMGYSYQSAYNAILCHIAIVTVLEPGKSIINDCWWKWTYPTCFQHTICWDTFLVTMLVNKNARIPSEFIQALIRDRKKRGRQTRETELRDDKPHDSD